jgi:hypothetical protein
MTSSSSTSKRFADVILSEDAKKLRYSKSTQYATESAVKLFNKFFLQRNVVVDRNLLDFKVHLDSIIADFLLSVRKTDGEYYSISGFNNLFFAIARHILDEYSLDIIHDTGFIKTLNTRKLQKGILKKIGKGHVSHTDTINQNDLEKIANMDSSTPLTLQLKCWFLLQYHLALRGRENLDSMVKEDLIMQFENGSKYIEIRDMATKNHRGDNTEKSNGAKMFSTPGSECPVRLVELYMSKLHPENRFLWQRPKKVFSESSQIWYDNQKCGVNTVGKFMNKISEVAKLSKAYTNHCARATCITILGKTFQDTDIATHSGHKSMNSMKIYKRTDDTTKKSMSNALSAQLAPVFMAPCVEETSDHKLCCISHGSHSTSTNFSTSHGISETPTLLAPAFSTVSVEKETFDYQACSSNNVLTSLAVSENNQGNEELQLVEEEFSRYLSECHSPPAQAAASKNNADISYSTGSVIAGKKNVFHNCTFNFHK